MTEPPDTMDAAMLARAARRCAGRPEFLGYWLEVYRETEGLEPTALARHLGCSLLALQELALCMHPTRERLPAATARLAERFGVDRKRLAEVILQAEAFARAREQPTSSRKQGARAKGGYPVFAAASDRVSEPDEPQPEAPAGEETEPDDRG